MSEQQTTYTVTPSHPVAIAPNPLASPVVAEAKLDDKTRRALVRYFVTMKKAAETMLVELER